MNLVQFLSSERDDIVVEAFASLHATQLVHYVQAGDDECRRRLGALYEQALQSVRDGSLQPITDHSVRVAQARFAAGHSLDEVLEAYDALEAAAWRHITGTLSPTAAVSVLARLRTVLGAGEEAVATAFAHLAKTQGAPTPDLELLYEGVD